MRKIRASLLALVSGVLSIGELTQAQEDSSRQIEEIVVTARRRNELLQDTPVSVTALDASALQTSNITRIDQVTQLAPNLQFDTAAGTSSTARVFIRGVGINDTIMTNQPGVGVYVDGVYLARSQGAVLDILDVAQIEVLRGPQGTLFGKNTAGGAVSVTTIKPGPELNGWLEVRPGNFDSVDTRAGLNIPLDWGILEDRVFTRFAFVSRYNDGYTFNQERDENWSNRNSLSFLGSVRLLPTDDITIDLSGTWSRNHAKPRGGKCFFVREVATQGLVPGFADTCRRSQASDPFDFRSDVAGLSDLISYGTWGTVEWNLGKIGPIDELTVKSITAWREQRDRTRRDFDMTEDGIIAINIVGGPRTLDGEPFTSRQFSEELQLLGNAMDDRLSFVGGFYYLADQAREVSGTEVLYDLDNFIPGSSSVADREVDNETFAFFGQATFDLTEWLSLTAGVRWTEDRQGYRIFNRNVTAIEEPKDMFDEQPIPSDLITQNTDDKATFTDVTPMASIALTLPDEHKPAALDHLMGYFTWAEGFKGGGFNARTGSGFPADTPPPTFDPESVTTYELGIKSVFFDRRLVANAAVFYSDYSDQQVLTLRALDCATEEDPTCIMILPINDNAADSTILGAELEVTALPIDGLALTWNVGWLDTEYDDFVTTSQFDDSEINRSGESFNLVPEFTTFTAAQYTLPIEPGDWTALGGGLTPRIEWYYRSEVHLNGPELESSQQSGVGLLNARLAYSFLDDRMLVAMWGRNLTDEAYKTDSIPLAPLGFDTVYFAPPRTFGAEISYRF